MKLFLTCEHGGNHIPKKYQSLFLKDEAVLKSHRGFDPGALDLFMELRELSDFDHFETTSRLLIELNRSLHHPQLFSELTRNLSEEDKNKLLEEIYFPYRLSVNKSIKETISAGEEVLHLSVHTFTPVLNGQVRKADIGLLYDPQKSGEKEFCKKLKEVLREQESHLRVRFNYPYRGTSDGFTTSLRKSFPQHYYGIEIEVNQKFTKDNLMEITIKNAIFKALSKVLTSSTFSGEKQ